MIRADDPRAPTRVALSAVMIAVFTAGIAVMTVAVLGAHSDAMLFSDAAADLLTPAGFDVFSDPHLQVGPLYLIALVPGVVASRIVGGSPVLWQTAYLHVALVLLLARLSSPRRSAPERLIAVMVAGLIAAMALAPVGHYEEGFCAALVLAAAVQSAKGRLDRATPLLVAAAAVKAWGLLGVLLLPLAYPGVPALMVFASVGLTAAGTALTLAPFALFGTFNTFHLQWSVSSGAPMSVLVPVGSPIGWLLRVGQAAGVAAAVALVGRCRPRPAAWQFTVALIATRILLDPLAYAYYTAALALVLIVSFPPAGRRRSLLAIVTVTAVAVLPYLNWVTQQEWINRAMLVGLILPAALLTAAPIGLGRGAGTGMLPRPYSGAEVGPIPLQLPVKWGRR